MLDGDARAGVAGSMLAHFRDVAIRSLKPSIRTYSHFCGLAYPASNLDVRHEIPDLFRIAASSFQTCVPLPQLAIGSSAASPNTTLKLIVNA